MNVSVDGATIAVDPGSTVLEAVRRAGRDVPTLCFDERLTPFGACRVCLVAVDGKPSAACTTPCRDGMRIELDDPRARRVAAQVLELVLSELSEPPEPDTELAVLARNLGVSDSRWAGAFHETRHDEGHPYLVLRHELCISCGRCIRACDELQGAFALTATGRGFDANVAAGLGTGFVESACVSCGACADTCPTGAITEKRAE